MIVLYHISDPITNSILDITFVINNFKLTAFDKKYYQVTSYNKTKKLKAIKR